MLARARRRNDASNLTTLMVNEKTMRLGTASRFPSSAVTGQLTCDYSRHGSRGTRRVAVACCFSLDLRLPLKSRCHDHARHFLCSRCRPLPALEQRTRARTQSARSDYSSESHLSCKRSLFIHLVPQPLTLVKTDHHLKEISFAIWRDQQFILS